jgi:hypothetical protein
VKFKVMVTMVGEEEEVVIKVINIRDGTEGCHVGFLPRHIGYGGQKDKLNNKYVQVMVIYKVSEDFTKNMKNRHLVGVASFRLSDNIQDLE